MAPIAGWYQDPSDPGQMRYWAGAKWTDATGPMPRPRQTEPTVPDPVMAAAVPAPMPGQAHSSGLATASWPSAAAAPSAQYPPAAGFGYPAGSSTLPGWGQAPQRSRFSAKGMAAVAVGIAAIVAAVLTVPHVLDSGKSGLAKSFQNALLTPQEVSSETGMTFTIDNSPDDNSNDGTSGCDSAGQALDNLGSGKGDAERELTSPGGVFVVEALSNNSAYASQLREVRSALNSCQSMTIGGNTVTVTSVMPPVISGSDDVLEFQMNGEVSGHPIVVDETLALFGHNLLGVLTTAVGDTQEVHSLELGLLSAAITKARPVLHRNS
jgi:hypothetical protein